MLQVVNITKAAGGRQILQQVNLEAPEASMIALVGESGGGKTTLCRILTGLEKPDSGEIYLDGKLLGSLRQRSFEECASIQYVFQDPYASMEEDGTVEGTLAEPVRLCRRNGRKFLEPKEALEYVGFDEKGLPERKIKTLSGGQRQKIALARALITYPRIIVADESTSMLDEESVREIAGIFKNLNQRLGISFIIVTHNIDIMLGLCKFLYVFRDGRIVDNGPGERIFSLPGSAYTMQLVECMKKLKGGTFFEQDNIC